MTDETRYIEVKAIMDEISMMENKIALNKEKINSEYVSESLKSDLIDDNRKYLNRLEELNKELDKWKR